MSQDAIWSTVTVGDLLRFLNAEGVKAARQKDHRRVMQFAERSGQVECALALYNDEKTPAENCASGADSPSNMHD